MPKEIESIRDRALACGINNKICGFYRRGPSSGGSFFHFNSHLRFWAGSRDFGQSRVANCPNLGKSYPSVCQSGKSMGAATVFTRRISLVEEKWDVNGDHGDSHVRAFSHFARNCGARNPVSNNDQMRHKKAKLLFN